MTLANGLLAAGVALTLLGLVGIVACIVKARALKQEKDEAKARAITRGLIALNMGGVCTACLGLGLVVMGLFF